MGKKKHNETPGQQLLAKAKSAAERCGTWLELHNAVFGIGGPYQELFPTQAERTEFSKSSEYAEIQKLIQDLPRRDAASEAAADAMEKASGKFVLRLPKSLHAALIIEADREGVSLNQLVLAKVALQLGAAALQRP